MQLDLSTREAKQALIDGFVNAIYLYDDHAKLILNYKNDTKTITLDELQGSDFNSVTAPKNSTDFRLCYFLCAQKCFRRKTGLMLQWIFCYEKLIPEFDWCSDLTKPGTLRNKIKVTHKWDAAVYYIYQGQGGNL